MWFDLQPWRCNRFLRLNVGCEIIDRGFIGMQTRDCIKIVFEYVQSLLDGFE